MTNPKPPSNGPEPSKVVGDHYRVWSLTGQGFLTFIPTDGATKEKNDDGSGTGKENSNGAKKGKNTDSSETGKENPINEGEITARKNHVVGKREFFLEFKENGEKYHLQLNTDYTRVEKLSSDDKQDPAPFYFADVGFGSPFKALVTVDMNGKKCLASNSAKKLSMKTYNQDTPHPDTLFLITEV